MSKPVVAEHGGIQITYSEAENKWTFELRGRERKVESLAKAKEAIDKPEPVQKASTFQRTKCWYHRWREEWRMVEATSVAAATGRDVRNGSVWIMDGKDRSKESARGLYPADEANSKLVARHNELEEQIQELKTEQEETVKKMKCLQLPEIPEEDKD